MECCSPLASWWNPEWTLNTQNHNDCVLLKDKYYKLILIQITELKFIKKLNLPSTSSRSFFG